jgi:hypothetical protein
MMHQIDFKYDLDEWDSWSEILGWLKNIGKSYYGSFLSFRELLVIALVQPRQNEW